MSDWDKMMYGFRAVSQRIGDLRFTIVSPGCRFPAGARW
jgi:hypothetical protein